MTAEHWQCSSQPTVAWLGWQSYIDTSQTFTTSHSSTPQYKVAEQSLFFKYFISGCAT